MKKNVYVLLAAVILVIAMAGGAFAGSTTASVTASATVNNICVAAGSPAINFGSIDASSTYTGNVNLSGMTLWCTKNDAAVKVTVGNGSYWDGSTMRMKASGSLDYIPYAVACTAGCSAAVTGQGKSTDLITTGVVAMHGNITAGGLDNVPADSYSDTVTLTIDY